MSSHLEAKAAHDLVSWLIVLGVLPFYGMDMSERRVVSAAELDVLSPEGRERHFAESLVAPDQLRDDHRQRIIDRQNRLIAEREQRAS